MSIDTRPTTKEPTTKGLAAKAVTPAAAQRAARSEPAKTPEDKTLDDKLSLGFGDLVDAVNPLQQLPVVSSVYREATGETISIPARLAGGFLFGGLPGLIGSAAMVAFEEVTGDSVLGHIGSLIDGEESATATATTAGTPAGALPWLDPGDGGNGGMDPSLPSPQALAEALRRKTAPAETAPASAQAAIPAAIPTDERPAPQLLARLYSLEATGNAATPGQTRKGA
ncbi:hypothetical protein VY88_25565 [Azospirillum thiophilum]|uniref:Uncharacterized protein n=1 Tax=Azospirillum thiophilum TaxID=528244 RepID=A0AAC8W4G4_9PROT|nr:hypothetical protein [Azospirillum thiophilum]ALG74940.1 hypothetical protein AL072_28485 [Azospirillum thiophilum]KJR62328.1 hypothetical protein VY88_25565 [Azospirillum thiophilum]